MPGGPAKSAAKSKPRQPLDGEEEGKRPASSTGRIAWRRTFRDAMRLVARVIDNGVRTFHVVMKIIGPCFICLALGLIGFVVYTYFTSILPSLEEEWGLSGQIGITIVGAYILSNLLYNYGKSIATDPGLPPEYDEALKSQEAEELSQPPPKQCKHCSRLKPARAHHCSVCRRCVLKMDHHCPWINNCVGYGNYRHFCLFMLFLATGCCFVICVYFRQFYNAMFNVRHRPRLERGARQSVMTSFMISCSILIALCILGGFHVYLVLTNQTTIEFQLNLLHRREARRNGEYFRNPYDMGRRRNFQQVFGPNAFCKFLWLMPYLAVPPIGDGVNFNSINGVKI